MPGTIQPTLDQLHDIVLPAPVSWIPQTVGWCLQHSRSADQTDAGDQKEERKGQAFRIAGSAGCHGKMVNHVSVSIEFAEML